MNRIETLGLFNSLNEPTLKVKSLTTENFLNIHKIKMDLKKYLNTMSDNETELFKSFGIKEGDQIPNRESNPQLWSALETLQKEQYTIDQSKLNTIPIEELKLFLDDSNLTTASIITEYFLKES